MSAAMARMLREKDREERARQAGPKPLGIDYGLLGAVMVRLFCTLVRGLEKFPHDPCPRTAADHVMHARHHLLEWSQGDRREDHLSHALTRVVLALNEPD